MEKNNATIYDAFAPYYERWHDSIDYKEIAAFIIRNAGVSAKDRVFEGGCGAGHLTEELAKQGVIVHGMDISERMLRIAKERTANLPVTLQQGDLAQLSVQKGYAAWIFCLDVLHYIGSAKELARLFRTAYLSLPEEGTLIFDLLKPGVLQTRSRSGAILYSDNDAFMAWETDQIRPDVFQYTLHLFRRKGILFQREREIHQLRAYSRKKIERLLYVAGFSRIACRTGYGRAEKASRCFRDVWIAKK